MVRVYLWFPGKPGESKWFHAVTGHITIEIGSEYCSFWPRQDKSGGSKENIGLISPSPADFSKTSYNADVLGMEYPADDFVEIVGLEEKSMICEWNKIKNQKTLYELDRANCCTVTAKLLNVGFINTKIGRIFMAKTEKSSLRSLMNDSNNFSGFKTPSALLFFAYLIKNEIEGHGQTEIEIMRSVRGKHPLFQAMQSVRNFLGI